MMDSLTEILRRILHIERRIDRLESLEMPTVGGGGVGAPNDAQYVVLALDAGLTSERVLTEGPDIDLVDAGANSTITVGRGGDTILLFDSGGNPIEEFAPTDAGLTAALAAATSGDTVEIPCVTIAGNHTISAGVTLRGQDRAASQLTGTITLGNGAILSHCYVNVSGAGGTIYGVYGPASTYTAYIQYCTITVTNSSGNAYGVLNDQGGTTRIWTCEVRATGTGDGYGVFVDNGAVIYFDMGVCIGSTDPSNV